MIDVVQEINATRREVGSRTLEAGEARASIISRTYDAAPDDVWDACTNPERIPRWFLPISGELRVGGRYALEGLSPAPEGRTRFELEHVAHVDDDRWAQFGPGATGVGWDLGLMGLSQHLASGAAADPRAAAAWAASEEGRRFMTLSSERWRDASVAAGADTDAARAAANRTTAFYTGAETVE